MWAKVAEEMQVPWRAAEAMHWQLGNIDIARRAQVVPFSLEIVPNEPQNHQRTSPTSCHAHSSYPPGLPGIAELTTGVSPYRTPASILCSSSSSSSSSGGGVPPLLPPLPPGVAGPGYTSPIRRQSHSHNGTASPDGTFLSTVLSSSSSPSPWTCPPLEMKLAPVHHPPSPVRPLLIPTRLFPPITVPPASYQAPVTSAPAPSKRTFSEAFRGEATANAAWRDPSDELARASGKRQRLTPLAAAGANLLCVWHPQPPRGAAARTREHLSLQAGQVGTRDYV